MDKNQIDPRERLNCMFPRWIQPAITWVSGKALPNEKPLFGFLSTPTGKIVVASMTIGLGVLLGMHCLAVVAV